MICDICIKIRGSSPLARGLLSRHMVHSTKLRIIPARAGFTRRRAERASPGADHPRSRGVYTVQLSSRPGAGGSSPLARGLPARAHWPPQSMRIIPARAGFTRGRGFRASCSWDHPRSRGVYPRSRSTSSSRRGSSPLARGLPVLRRVLGRRSGIIPARAGFTSGPGRSRPRSLDHPRSRGVYALTG